MLGLLASVGALALHLGLPPAPCPVGCGDPLACAITLSLRVVNALLGHAC